MMILDINAIQAILPHRYPFLLVDAIEEMERWKRIVGVKNVTINESFFQGHFPGKPIMPGVLIIESMAQTGGLLLLQEVLDREKKVLDRVTMQVFVDEACTMIAAPIQCDVDGIPKGLHCALLTRANERS